MKTETHHQETGNLTSKELKDSELVELHLGLFKRYIKNKITNLRVRKVVQELYDSEINKDNIRLYYNRKISIFTAALVTGKLETIIKHRTF